MKKMFFLSLFGLIFLLVSCGPPTPKSATSSSSSTNVTSNESSSSVLPTVSDDSVSSASKESSENNSIATQDQTLQFLVKNSSELQNEDIVVKFYKMIDSDYLFTAQSKSILKQGGSGTVGFYRVSPQGTIANTDAYGNPF